MQQEGLVPGFLGWEASRLVHVGKGTVGSCMHLAGLQWVVLRATHQRKGTGLQDMGEASKLPGCDLGCCNWWSSRARLTLRLVQAKGLQ